MTLLYTLLRIPGNIEEFADKAKRKGITTATVGTELEIENEAIDRRSHRFLAADYVYYITVHAGRLQYSSRNPEYWASIASSCTREPKIAEIFDRELRQKSLRVAERLNDLGLETKLKDYKLWNTFEPISIEEAKKIAGIE